MPLKIAIQMDPIESINIKTDTTYVLAKEAEQRGFEVLYFQPKNLSMLNGKLVGTAQSLKLNDDPDNFYELGEKQNLDFAAIDVVLMRQDPPFDINYLTYTYFLEFIAKDTLVVNNPTEVRNCPEKIFALEFASLMPPTLISEDMDEIEAFYKEHKDIIIKPLYAFGGDDVFRVEDNLEEIVSNFKEKYNHPFIIQKYLPEIKQGDKRIILIDGQPKGALNRIPEEGNIRSNLAQGGSAFETELTEKDLEICNLVGPELKKRGLILAGIDVIGDYLTEINVTSPTGIQAINQLSGLKLEADFWDVIVEKLNSK